MEAKVTSKRDKEKLVTLQDINDMDQTTTIKLNGSKGDFEKRQGETGDFARYQWYGSDNNNQSTGSFTVGETNKKMYIYCGKQHCSDECNEYPNLQSGKSKAKGFCFICLRKGHLLRECNSTRAWVYCKKKGNHRKGLCPSQFSIQQKECRMHHLKRKKPI